MRLAVLLITILVSTGTVQASNYDVNDRLQINIKACLQVPNFDYNYMKFGGGTRWDSEPDGYGCFRVIMHPGRHGVLSLWANGEPERYELLAVEIFPVTRGGKVVGYRPGQTFSNDYVVKEGRLSGRMMVFSPSPEQREFFVITYKPGGGRGQTTMSFDNIWVPGVVAWAVGKTAFQRALTGGIVSGAGLEGWEADLGDAILSTMVAGLEDTPELTSGESVAGIVANAVPDLATQVYSLGPALMFNIYRTLKQAFTAGVARKPGDPVLRF